MGSLATRHLSKAPELCYMRPSRVEYAASEIRRLCLLLQLPYSRRWHQNGLLELCRRQEEACNSVMLCFFLIGSTLQILWFAMGRLFRNQPRTTAPKLHSERAFASFRNLQELQLEISIRPEADSYMLMEKLVREPKHRKSLPSAASQAQQER